MYPIDAAIDGLELREYAKSQPQYKPLPARVDSKGAAITCWQLTWRERLSILLRGRFYLTILTFNKPLQPIRCSIDKPEVE